LIFGFDLPIMLPITRAVIALIGFYLSKAIKWFIVIEICECHLKSNCFFTLFLTLKILITSSNKKKVAKQFSVEKILNLENGTSLCLYLVKSVICKICSNLIVHFSPFFPLFGKTLFVYTFKNFNISETMDSGVTN